MLLLQQQRLLLWLGLGLLLQLWQQKQRLLRRNHHCRDCRSWELWGCCRLLQRNGWLGVLLQKYMLCVLLMMLNALLRLKGLMLSA